MKTDSGWDDPIDMYCPKKFEHDFSGTCSWGLRSLASEDVFNFMVEESDGGIGWSESRTQTVAVCPASMGKSVCSGARIPLFLREMDSGQ